MGKKVIILNGAPSSGKDTIASMFRSTQSFYHMEVKAELFEIALNLSGISKADWFERYNDREKNLKEVAWDRLGGLSQREFLIKISEEWMKPIFGSDIFGKKAAISVQGKGRSTSEFIFSDGGFQDELDAMVRELGEDNILLIRLHRKGTSFEGDSRGFLTHRHELDVHNDDTPRKAFDKIYFKYVDGVYVL